MVRLGLVPGEPVNMNEAIDQVIQGSRPGLLKDSHYWVLDGLEVVGQKNLTRLVNEGPATADEIRQHLVAMADKHGVTPSRIEPHKITQISPDELGGLFRATGRLRPWGGWTAVFPPEVIGSRAANRDFQGGIPFESRTHLQQVRRHRILIAVLLIAVGILVQVYATISLAGTTAETQVGGLGALIALCSGWPMRGLRWKLLLYLPVVWIGTAFVSTYLSMF